MKRGVMTVAQQVLEGTWEEIAAHAEELTGKRLKVIVETDAPTDMTGIPIVAPPNEGMLAALREIAERQKGRRQTEGDSVAIIRHGRSGPLYGVEPNSD